MISFIYWLLFRLVDMVNEFCEFYITDVFIWSILTMSMSLLAFELVEYILCNCHHCEDLIEIFGNF